MALASSTLVYVDYGERNPTVIHARLILEHIQQGDHLILTPDWDMYVETYDDSNTDIVNYWPALPGGGVPAAVNPNHVYGFRPMSADQYAGFMRAGRLEAIDERNRRGIGQVVGAAGAAAAQAAAPSQQVWVLAEMVEGHKIGERVTPAPGFPADGVWDLMQLANSSGATRPCLIHQLDESEIPTFCDERIRLCRLGEAVEGDDRLASDDVRTLEVRYGSANERQRTFKESVQELRVVEFEDFPITPRTTLEYVKAIGSIAESATAQHHMWISSSKIQDGDRSIYEDEILARVLDLALVYDALDVSNLACMEVVCRRRQLLADAHHASPGAPSYLGAEHYMGTTYKAGGGVVVPTLSDHVAKKMAAQSAIMKERRKLEENRKGKPKAAPKTPAKGAGASSQ